MSLHYLGISFGGQILMIAAVVVAALAAALAVRRRSNWVFGLNPAATCLALGSLVAIGISTLTPRTNAWVGGTVQLIPLHTLRGYLHRPIDLLIYAGGNVALFVPLGLFVYLALGRWVWRSTAACALISVCVELLQLHIWSRSSDVDDVISNTLGGLLGALAGYAVLRLIRNRRTPTAPDADPQPQPQAVGSRAS